MEKKVEKLISRKELEKHIDNNIDMSEVNEFLKTYLTKVGKRVTYKEKLSDAQISILEKQGYKVEHFTMTVGKDDNVDHYYIT